VEFTDKVAIVTGASQGIGKAVGLAFAKAGAKLAICARDKNNLENAAREIGTAVFSLPCDVASESEVASFVHQVQRHFGRIDILVNNAGETSSALLMEMDSAFWNRMLANNLTSVFLMTQAVLRIMMDQKYGRIVNVASMSAKQGSRYLSAYSATKQGVLGFTRSVALEMVDHGITVNAVCPGYVDTPNQEWNVQKIMRDRGLSRGEVRGLLEERNPRRRFISMGEVAQTILMLASDEAGAVTGEAIELW
jgi:NAD(P)-dependent dehydrogenase (short-subunit alcohol dehydrogenase family)